MERREKIVGEDETNEDDEVFVPLIDAEEVEKHIKRISHFINR